jgi:hypothetical protein
MSLMYPACLIDPFASIPDIGESHWEKMVAAERRLDVCRAELELRVDS